MSSINWLNLHVTPGRRIDTDIHKFRSLRRKESVLRADREGRRELAA